MSFGGLANCPCCWDAPEVCKCDPQDVENHIQASDVINKHRHRVFTYMSRIAREIMQRGNDHDQSKYSDQEFPVYARTIKEFDKHQFGTEGYKKAKESLGPALEHHFKHNRHHPEHFEMGIDGMTLVDLLEMVCDWKSATLNHPEKPGNMTKSLEMAIVKYNISPQLARVLYNTMREFGLD